MSGPRAAAKRPRRDRKTRRRPATGRDFWGTDEAEEDVADSIRPSDDPAAMVKSLGSAADPRLRDGRPSTTSMRCTTRRSSLAVALAAANGLLDLADSDEAELV